MLSWAARTDIGHRRAANEDSVLVGLPIFAVADGMGGHAAGDRASAAVVERLSPSHGPLRRRRPRSSRRFVDAGDDIDALAEGIPIGVGTTVTGRAPWSTTADAVLRGLQHRRQPGLPLRAQRAHAGDRSTTRSCRSWWMPASSPPRRPSTIPRAT